MKKILILIILVAAIGAGAFLFLKGQKATTKTEKPDKTWTAYSTEENHMVTLTDKMTAVSQGTHIAKFTVTLKFKNEHGYEKFEGLSKPLTEKEKKAAESGEHSSSDTAVVSPMNVKVNSLITNFMIQLGNEEAKDVEYIEKNMKDYLNENLGLEKDFIEEVYVEQYVIN